MRRLLVPATLALSLLVVSCSDDEVCAAAGVPAATSCAAGVEYDGHFYQQWGPRLPATRGDRLGEAIYPACVADAPCGADARGRDLPTTVWRLRGVHSEEVLVGREQGGTRWVVFGRDRAEPTDYFRLTERGQWRLRRQ